MPSLRADLRRASSQPQHAVRGGGGDRCPDGDVVGVGALLWIASLMRVVASAQRGEASAETALATLAVVSLPWLARDAIRWAVARLSATDRDEA